VLIAFDEQRYRSPVIPLVALLAGFGAVAVWEYARRRLEASPQAR